MCTDSSPLISIIIPVYKAESYLEKCISQVRNQSYTNMEILLVDDGSPDSSGTLCDGYAAADSRIRVFHKPNGGASDARNVGLDNATGEFVCFVDSDDEITADYIQGLYDDCTLYPDADLVIQCFLQKWPERDHIFKMPDSSYEVSVDGMARFFSEVFVNDFSGPYCKLFRRSIIEENNIRYSTRIIYGEDFDFLLRFLPFAKRITSSSKYNYIYIMHGGTVSSKIYSFDKELSAIDQLGGSFRALRSIFDSEGLQRSEGVSISAYVRRLISANYLFSYTRNERVKHFKQIGESYIETFAQYTETSSAFMKTIVWLIRNEFYSVLDMVLYLRLTIFNGQK